MSAVSDRVKLARENGGKIRAALTAPPPAREPGGVYAALADYRADILLAIGRGWTVAQLAALLGDSGVGFSKQSIAKAIDRIVDDALRAELAAGARPVGAIKKIIGVDITKANAQITARLTRRITRLTHTSSPSPNRRGSPNA